MRKIMLSLLPFIFFATDALACSLMPNFDIIRKNEMVVSAVNHMGQDLTDIKNLVTKDFSFNFGWTYSDPGFECHDTEAGTVTVLFSSDKVSGMYAAFYDAEIKKQFDDLYAANNWEAVAELDATLFKCDIEIKVEYSLKPESATQFGYPMFNPASGTAVCSK